MPQGNRFFTLYFNKVNSIGWCSSPNLSPYEFIILSWHFLLDFSPQPVEKNLTASIITQFGQHYLWHFVVVFFSHSELPMTHIYLFPLHWLNQELYYVDELWEKWNTYLHLLLSLRVVWIQKQPVAIYTLLKYSYLNWYMGITIIFPIKSMWFSFYFHRLKIVIHYHQWHCRHWL